KNFYPKTRSPIGFRISAQAHGLKDQNEQCEAHGELRKQIMESHCETELETMDIDGFHNQHPGVFETSDRNLSDELKVSGSAEFSDIQLGFPSLKSETTTVGSLGLSFRIFNTYTAGA